MPRRKKVEKKKTFPDPVYNSVLVTKFVNCIMGSGKKSVAESIFYNAMDMIKERMSQDPLPVFDKAVENVKPVVEVRSRRVGGATYQVPMEVRADRRQALAIRWLISYCRSRNEKTMSERLAGEIISAFKGEGSSIKKREDTHRMADANKAFAHYRW